MSFVILLKIFGSCNTSMSLDVNQSEIIKHIVLECFGCMFRDESAAVNEPDPLALFPVIQTVSRFYLFYLQLS